MNNEMAAMLVYEDNPIMLGIIGREDDIFLNHILLLANNIYTLVDRTNILPSLESLIPKLILFP